MTDIIGEEQDKMADRQKDSEKERESERERERERERVRERESEGGNQLKKEFVWLVGWFLNALVNN